MIDQEGPRMAEGERLDTKFQMTKLKHFSQIFQKEKLLSRVQLSVGIFKLLEISLSQNLSKNYELASSKSGWGSEKNKEIFSQSRFSVV